MSERYTTTFIASPEHIDQLGHVNNGVWVQWMEELATAHWLAIAPAEHVAAYVWVVTRHEIDYRGNVSEGAEVSATTFIAESPRGARFDRHYEFSDAENKVLVRARSTWAMIERASGKLMRVPAEVAAPFQPEGGWVRL